MTPLIVPASNMKKAIVQILVDEGYVKSFTVVEDGKQGMIQINLKYGEGKTSVIKGLRRVSKPGLRIYSNAEDTAKGYQRPRRRYHLHFQGCYDRPSGPQRECWRRSSGIHLVR